MNASASWFTSYERALLSTTYGTQSARLSRDTSKPIDSCTLCLRRARDPVCCSTHGDLFCRECAVSNLLAQRVEIKRLQREIEKREEEEREDRSELERKAGERGVREFERVQMGLEGSSKKRKLDNDVTEEPTSSKKEKTTEGFKLDEEKLLEIALADRQRLKSAITSETTASQKSKLPSFWIPSLTPSAPTVIKAPKLQSVCPASDPDHLHYFSLKTLVSVRFEEEKDEKNKHGETVRICPSCRKGLSNEVKPMVAKPCGHVICTPCANKFVLNSEKDENGKGTMERRCFVCAEDLVPKKRKKREHGKKEREEKGVERGIVQISGDGTGFTGGGGRVMATKGGIAFQC